MKTNWLLLPVLGASFVPPLCAQNSTAVVPVVKNAPFTAQEWTTVSRQQPDGTTLSVYHRADIARDSAGATRRLGYAPTSSDTSQVQQNRTLVSIHKPDAKVGAAYDAVTNQHVLKVSPHKQLRTLAVLPGAVVPGSEQTQSLGDETVNGLSTTKTRRTYSYRSRRQPDGVPIAVTEDTWYSQDLVFVVKKVVHDSSGTTREMELRSIVRAEPDASLFIVP